MKTKSFFLTMIAVFAMVTSFTSCSKEELEELTTAEYFITVDETSNEYVEYVFNTAFGGEDYVSLGECEKDDAIDAFNYFCSNIDLEGLGTATVSLRSESPNGKKIKTKVLD